MSDRQLRSLETVLADLRTKVAGIPESSRSRLELEKMIRDLEQEIADRQSRSA